MDLYVKNFHEHYKKEHLQWRSNYYKPKTATISISIRMRVEKEINNHHTNGYSSGRSEGLMDATNYFNFFFQIFNLFRITNKP